MWVGCSMFKFHTEFKDWIIFKLEYLSQQFSYYISFPTTNTSSEYRKYGNFETKHI